MHKRKPTDLYMRLACPKTRISYSKRDYTKPKRYFLYGLLIKWTRNRFMYAKIL